MAEPWEQREGEGGKAFIAFCCYRNLGPARTTTAAMHLYREMVPTTPGNGGGRRKAIGEPQVATGQFTGWASKYDWVNRARLYDQYIEMLKAKEIETAAKEEARKWAGRHSKLREQEWEMGQILLEKAQEMLDYPLVRTEVESEDEEGNARTVIVIPADWKPVDAMNFLKAASQLGRMGIGTHIDLTATRDSPEQEMVVGGKRIRF